MEQFKIVLTVMCIFTYISVTSAGYQCPGNYIESYGKCFYFSRYNNQRTWESARGYCNGHYNGDLADSYDSLKSYIRRNDIRDNYWVGVTDAVREGNWYWVDGSSLSSDAEIWGNQDFGFWRGGGEPNGGKSENCAIIVTKDGEKLHDYGCQKSVRFICETARVYV